VVKERCDYQMNEAKCTLRRPKMKSAEKLTFFWKAKLNCQYKINQPNVMKDTPWVSDKICISKLEKVRKIGCLEF